MQNLAERPRLGPLEAPQSWSPEPSSGEVHAIRRILVCLDESPFSEACLSHAVAISKSLGSSITLLHVMQPARQRGGLQSTNVLDWEIARQEASALLQRLERQATLASGRPVDTRLEQGLPAERITAVALELGADLTILGSQGERDLGAWNLGSTLMQVLERSRGSVLLARRLPPGADAPSPRRLLVPLDGSFRSESVLPTVARIAAAHGAEVLLVLAVPEPVATAVLRLPDDLAVARDLASRLQASGERYLDTLRDRLGREGIRAATRVVRSPDVRQSILELSREERSDLVVLSAHGSTCNPTLTYGSFTTHLLTHSLVPLLVLQDLRGPELRERDDGRRAPPLRVSFPEGS